MKLKERTLNAIHVKKTATHGDLESTFGSTGVNKIHVMKAFDGLVAVAELSTSFYMLPRL